MSDRVKEDIENIVYKIVAERVLEDREKLEKAFFDFLSCIRKNTLNKKFGEKDFGIFKALVIDILKKLKKNRRIFGGTAENFENQLNEVIYSTKLNKIKSAENFLAEGSEAVVNEKVFEKYDEINKILSFDYDAFDIENEYDFWCFLKIGRMLFGMYENAENNILTNDFTVGDVKNTMTFVFKNSDGTGAELLYNYESKVGDKGLIYLVLKKRGRVPVSFAFSASEKSDDELHALRDGLCGELCGRKHFLFSGIFSLRCDDFNYEAGYFNALKNKVGKINFSPDNTAAVSDLLSKIGIYKTAAEEYICTAELGERIKKYEIEKRNMLVVTVKSKEQLEINLNNGFYYMPLANLPVSRCNYEYLAVYQSFTNFGEASGIIYFGEISDASVVRRNEITEIPRDSSESYLRFSVKWQMRNEKIKPDCYVKSFAETSDFLFRNAKNVSELFIGSYEEYEICGFFKKNFKNVEISATESGIYEIKSDKLKMEFSSVFVSLWNGESLVFSLSGYAFKKNLKNILKKISESDF